MPQFTDSAPRHVTWASFIRWGGLFLLIAVLCSWPLSFFKTQRLSVALTRRYELILDRGTVQFWRTIKTDVITANGQQVVRETGYREIMQGIPVLGGPTASGPHVLLSWRRVYSTVTFEIGAQVPQIVNGQLQYLFAGEKSTILAVPHWAVAIGLIPLAGWWLVHWRRQRFLEKAAAAGLCTKCGYDLRATPERCPECGHPADNAPGQTIA